jgi:hypothetical protein
MLHFFTFLVPVPHEQAATAFAVALTRLCVLMKEVPSHWTVTLVSLCEISHLRRVAL